MTNTKHIVFFVFEGCQLLDYSGVAAVFEMANRCSGKILYETSIVCATGHRVSASNGLVFEATPMEEFLERYVDKPLDMFVAIGGDEDDLVVALNDLNTQKAVQQLCDKAVLKCSICSGAFFLAICGQLDFKKATTHWSGIDKLAALFPNIDVQDHVLYTIDGDTLSSAGVATGIDLALEVVSIEHGIELSSKVAKRLVVSMHRPGNASQLQLDLSQQNSQQQQFRSLCIWLKQHLFDDISVEAMAEFMNMSPRNFSRRFKEATSYSPRQYFVLLKIEHAKLLLSRGYSSDQICEAVGYSNKQSFNRIFKQHEGISIFQYSHPELIKRSY